MKNFDDPGWRRALFRHTAVSQVEALVLSGRSLASAVAAVSGMIFPEIDGRPKKPGRASLYRWYKAYKADGIDGLFDRPQPGGSPSLPGAFLHFLGEEKEQDPDASIPEIITRARVLKLIGPNEVIDRTTAYRAARAMNLPMFRRRKLETRDSRPFEYRHRMQMILADGKHFRAGGRGLRRVALFFLDDATRLVLDVFVGPSESAAFFLKAFRTVISNFGFMGAFYLDRGPGFIAGDTRKVFALLQIPLIFGRARYPEGHGKIERFNDTVLQACLRGLDKPEIDPDYTALEIRIRHYLHEFYNRRFHEGIRAVPAERFARDERPLSYPASEEELTQAFTLSETRKVRKDNTIPWGPQLFEIPLGHAGRRIRVYRDVLTEKISMMHEGRMVELHPADLNANARAKRAKAQGKKQPKRPVTTAAELSFQQQFAPITDIDGGFVSPSEQTEEQPS